MNIHTETDWGLTLNYLLADIVGASAWSMKLVDRAGRELVDIGRRGDIGSQGLNFRRAMSKLAASAVSQGESFAWMDLETTDDGDSLDRESPGSLLLVFVPISANEILTGGVLLDRSALGSSVFQNEGKLIHFLAGAVAGVASARRAARETSAVKSLLSVLAVQCIIIDQSGRVIFQTSPSTEFAGLCEAQGNRGSSPFRKMVQQVLKQNRLALPCRSQRYQVVSVDLGHGKNALVYVLPLPNECSETKKAEFLALFFPRPFEPPCDDALTTAFSLTPSEAKVVRHIMFGKRVSRIADEMSLTEQTVRTYLKRTYAKLHVSSQSELIAKVSGLSVPLRAYRD